ncbi:amylo-alpha-1,6-glucosidase [Saccharothrix syringae]|uniref:Amylo-alpha-1,6-glucosidase n=1 Tax=Saccharothrix syringae TaxID=103733 RepID=A0A5Q0GZ03_SACSY|nr:glycogen debranching N-terminal domain-containing protein [Saccharothrix syringae]QFZ19189.1 amylo-alpha-1,6-glucosidase [Saccharothrix syringae]
MGEGGWAFDGEPVALSPSTVTLVHGTSFCVCGSGGDIEGAAAQGAFFQDTRILSGWRLRVDGSPVEHIATTTPDPFRARFVGRGRSRVPQTESTLFVRRERYVGAGMREDVVLRNYGRETVAHELTIHVEADFADLFEVKESRVRPRGEHVSEVAEDGLRLTRRLPGSSRGTRVWAADAECSPATLTFRAVIPPKGEWSTCVTVQPVVDGEAVETLFPAGRPIEQSVPARREQQWRQAVPVLRRSGNRALAATLLRSRQDLGALRIFDPERPEDTAIAAGAPWFMTLFGRDSILASYLSLAIDPGLALGTVRTLAHHQGTRVDPGSEEEPGRILHEMRFGADASLALGGGNVYYGTADATPLFVVLVGELSRWGIGRDRVEAVLPHVDRALEWVERYGDRDGDGFVEYARATDRGLVNQGWKDSWDGVNFADGRIARAPIALCEVQGYAYSAYLARACLCEDFGDPGGARHWRERAARLKERFNERFWLPDLGRYAVALDADKQPVDALASNVGHCLWTGIVDDDKAALVADDLLSPRMFTGWGVRTLATDMGAYNPMSYHNGSVWPHDSALVATGLMRYGFVEHAQRVATAVLDAAEAFGGRLPELLCGFDRADHPEPVPYPTSCSPQAWASATPIHLLRVLLRVEPSVPHRKVWLAPVLPGAFTPLALDGIPLAGARVSLEVDRDGVRVIGLPDDVEPVHDVVRRHPGAVRGVG